MKKMLALTLISGALLTAAGCASTATENAPKTPAQTDSAKTPAAKSTGNATPTAAAEAMFAAVKNKDAAALRNQLSANSLKQMEESAKLANQPTEKYLADVMGQVPVGDKFEAKNEKIEGDKATVEMIDKNGKWSKNRFVKENGSWRTSLD